MATLRHFHPAVATWFHRRFPEGPSLPQAEGWPLISAGHDTLICAPTGSGKTLAGFLLAIDAAYKAHDSGELLSGSTRLLYVSPLKALAVDIHQNLEVPLAEIAQIAAELGLTPAPITVAVRTGDTPTSERSAMVKNPPTFLVTTPESLYLLLTSDRSRATLRCVSTVIVDEIHALARDKRGSHLTLTLERLEGLQSSCRPQRIGLSATQRPIEKTAEILGGHGRPVKIVDSGQRKDLSLALEIPSSELGAVASNEQFGEVIERIAAHVKTHRTTLVFVNTRRMAERIAHLLAEHLGDDKVAAHHGSLSKQRRLKVESRLRAGELGALVATASLELGIDIGEVELVCQVGSPRSIATFVQRVGRSNHSRSGTPEGVLFPLTRDELVECSALLAAVRSGDMDITRPPVAPLDVLAQQIVAEVAARDEITEDDLFRLITSASPYANLQRSAFEEVVELVSEGITTGRGKRMSYLHRDRVNGVLRPRRGARLAAITSGGTIPEVGDYRVVLDPDDVTVGTVNEDFAIESMIGDVFLLGSHSWRIRRVESGTVRVVDAAGANPTIPFWIGEAPSRTEELSAHVSNLREVVAGSLGPTGDDTATAVEALSDLCGIDAHCAKQLIAYLHVGFTQLGTMPTEKNLVFERFFDEAGGMQLVVHSPLGGRINKAYGLALRKKFCATFDFELQAAASDDAFVLSLGPQHSFPLESASRLLRSSTAREALSQAVLASPMFTSRWRWNLTRALAILRFKGGRKNPLPIQRMESDDLMAAVFPALAACQENAAAGPIRIPEHLLVRQTLDDCLHEAMDVDALVNLLEHIETGKVNVHFVDSPEPSVFSHEILNARPYAFLDDAPLEERRTRAVQTRRGLPLEPEALAHLDPDAIARVREETKPLLRNAEELHDLLHSCVVLEPSPAWAEWFGALVTSGRAMEVRSLDPMPRWCALERRDWVEAILPGCSFEPTLKLPEALAGAKSPDPDDAAAEALRGHLDIRGPVTVSELAAATGLTEGRVRSALAILESEGSAMQGHFDHVSSDSQTERSEQWCSRRLLARIHSYSQARLRREIEPVTAQDFMRFLLSWHHVIPGRKLHGRAGTLAVVDQLQGYELAAGSWEEDILSCRVENYQRQWLEELCLSGQVTWGRLSVRSASVDSSQHRRGAATPSKATPITLASRADFPWLLCAIRGESTPEIPAVGASREVLESLRMNGALFHADIAAHTHRLPAEVEEGLWDLVSRGIVTADGFQAVRSLLSSRDRWRRRMRHDAKTRLGPRRLLHLSEASEGRWSIMPGLDDAPISVSPDIEELAESIAAQLLTRWGVVFWDLYKHESFALPWREVLRALRRFEARGLVRGGRFVTGFIGEQYALPEAVDELRVIRRTDRDGTSVTLSAVDPLNLVGIVLPGERVPALRSRHVTFTDGLSEPLKALAT